MTLKIIFCIKEVVVFFQVFFDPNVDKVLQHLFQLVKVHVTGLLCKGKLTRLSVADSIFKNYFLTDQIITTAHIHPCVALLGRGEASLE